MVFEHAAFNVCRNGKTAITTRLAGKYIFLAAYTNGGSYLIQRNRNIWLQSIVCSINSSSTDGNRGTIAGAYNGLLSAA